MSQKRNIAERAASSIARVWHGIMSHPVELLVLLHATISTFDFHHFWWQLTAYYASFATVAALCLSFHRSKRWVAVAYWAVLPLYALTALLPEAWSGITEYWLLTALLPAVYLLARGYHDFNARFFSMVRSAVVAMGVGMLTFLLLYIIYLSIQSLFSVTWYNVEEYILSVCFILFMPMVFIGMEGDAMPKASKLEEALLNWVLTPALLIYNVVLYVYLAVIVISWDLPKGSVATMVSMFIGAAVAVRWLRPMLQKQPLGWYFRWFGLIALPLVVLFWVATGYRISQYGFTIDRCILVATGVLMTAFVILSLVKTTRGGYWFLAGYVVVGLLLAVGGPLSARQVSLRSQTKVVRQYAKKIGILNADGTLIKPSHQESDSVYRKEHRAIYQSIKYIQNDPQGTSLCREQFGMTSSDYLEGLSKSTYSYAIAWQPERYYDEEVDIESAAMSFYLWNNSESKEIDISGYSRMIADVRVKGGRVPVPGGSVSADSVLATQLALIDYTPQSNIERETIDANEQKLLTYRSPDGSLLIVFSSMSIDAGKNGYYISSANVRYALKK